MIKVAPGMGDFGDSLDVTDVHERVAGRLNEHGFGVRSDGCFYGFKVGCVHQAHVHPEPRHVDAQQLLRSCVAHLGSHDMITAIEQREEHRRNGSHAACGDDAVFTPLQGGQALFKMPRCGAVFPGLLKLVQMIPGEYLDQFLDIRGQLIRIRHVNRSAQGPGFLVDSFPGMHTQRMDSG